MLTLERATTARRAGLWTVLGLIMVPLIVAGGFLWAGWNSDDRLGRVQAAVVNNDKPVTINSQLVPLGRQLAGGLVSADDDPNFTWVVTDTKDAAAGLASGAYAAVVTIPEDFSARATSFSSDEEDEIEQARLDVQTSQISGLADPVVGQAITAQATKVLNATLTENYLKQVYLGFNDTGRQFGKLAAAAGKLSDGTSGIADGLAKTESGTGEFAAGLGKLDQGTGEFAAGLGAYAKGADQFAAGTQKFAGGVDQLAGGADKLAKGADQLSAGVTTAVHAFRYGTDDHPGGTIAYAKGADQFADGLRSYQQQLQAISDDPDQLARMVPCPVEDEDSCKLFYGGMKAGIGVGISGFEDSKDPAGNPVPGLIPSARQLADGAAGIDAGIRQLGDPDAEQSLKHGLDRYAAGADKLAGGAQQLAAGGRQLADGADQLAAGADKLSAGATKLAEGTGVSAAGAAQLYNGMGKLSAGAAKLADGNEKFAAGLQKGKDQIPSYDKGLRAALSEVVATPVTSEMPRTIFPDVASTTLLAVIALWLGSLASFIVLRAVPARVLSSMRPSWRLALDGVLPAVVIGAAQALILTGVLGALLDLDSGAVAALGAVSLLSAATFASLNQALVAWLGGVGRFVSVLVVVLAAAAAITSALPAAFAAITPFLPTTPALAAMRAVVSDGTGAGNHSALVGAWLIVAAAAGILAVARRRMVDPLRTVAYDVT